MKTYDYICNRITLANPIFLTMDIVSRLKVFIDAKRIPVTQFADNCRIPRPSMSQLLSGRNKKVSDEVIAKIHDAYPNLSVMWLMFGEGNMDTDSNIETSEPQNIGNFDENPSQPAVDEQLDGRINFDFDYSESRPENSGANSNSFVTENRPGSAPQDTIFRPSAAAAAGSAPTPQAAAGKDAQTSATITLQSDPFQGKRVVGIVVYYNDNSYESFIPDSARKTPF